MTYTIVSTQLVDAGKVFGELEIPAELSAINRKHVALNTHLPFKAKKKRWGKSSIVFTLPDGWIGLEGPKNAKGVRQFFILDKERSLREYILSDGKMIEYNHINRYSISIEETGRGSHTRLMAYTHDHKVPFLPSGEINAKKRVGTSFAPVRIVDNWIEKQNWIAERLHKVYGPYTDLDELWDK